MPTIHGTAFDDVLNGSPDGDTINGNGGNDILNGVGGDDVLDGGPGADQLYGGVGLDLLLILNAPETVGGLNPHGEIFDGGTDIDTLRVHARAGTQVDADSRVVSITSATLNSIEALWFVTGSGFDFGRLTIQVAWSQLGSGLSTTAALTGGGSNTLQIVATAPDSYTLPSFDRSGWSDSNIVALVASGSGDFVLNASANHSGLESLTGALGNDTLNGSDGSEILIAGPGSDVLNAGGGGDLLRATNTYDVFGTRTLQTFAASQFNGGAGFDTLQLGGEIDFAGTLNSIEAIELLPAVDNRPYLTSSRDSALVRISSTTLASLPADLTLTGNGTLQVNLQAGDDFDGSAFIIAWPTVTIAVAGSAAADTITGTSSVDLIHGGDGDDVIDGGGGEDTALYDDAASDVTVDLSLAGPQATGDLGSDTLANIENLIGSAFADSLSGNASANHIQGGAGIDMITGGAGADMLTGDSGADRFIDTAAGLDGDTITDFSYGDRIIISDADIASFAYARTGTTLTYNDGTLILANAPSGHLVMSPVAGGGVELRLEPLVGRATNFDSYQGEDVFWLNENGSVQMWVANSHGGFDVRFPAGPVPDGWSMPATGDFDGDGFGDLFWIRDDGVFGTWMNNRSGGFNIQPIATLGQVPTSWHVVAAGDFNGDHVDDLLWRNDNGALGVWQGVDGGTNPTLVGTFIVRDGAALVPVSADWHVFGTGDFNGDGEDDILWRNDDGRVGTWSGSANGGFVVNDGTPLPDVPDEWHIVGTGDFNGDGRDDILWRNDEGFIGNWLGTAGGGFTINDANLRHAPNDWHVVLTGDFNADGRDDIFWWNEDGRAGDWLGTPGGGFQVNDVLSAGQLEPTWHVQPIAYIL